MDTDWGWVSILIGQSIACAVEDGVRNGLAGSKPEYVACRDCDAWRGVETVNNGHRIRACQRHAADVQPVEPDGIRIREDWGCYEGIKIVQAEPKQIVVSVDAILNTPSRLLCVCGEQYIGTLYDPCPRCLRPGPVTRKE